MADNVEQRDDFRLDQRLFHELLEHDAELDLPGGSVSLCLEHLCQLQAGFEVRIRSVEGVTADRWLWRAPDVGSKPKHHLANRVAPIAPGASAVQVRLKHAPIRVSERPSRLIRTGRDELLAVTHSIPCGCCGVLEKFFIAAFSALAG